MVQTVQSGGAAGAVPAVLDVAVIMQRRFSLEQWKCRRFQLIAWFGGHPSSQQRQVSQFGAMKGCFSAFLGHFFALLRVVPELSASFWSWGALDEEEFFVMEGSGGSADAGSFSQVLGYQLCIIGG